MKRVVILAHRERGYEIGHLVIELCALGLFVEVCHPRRFSVVMGRTSAIMYDGTPFELPDLLLVRTGSATGSHANVIISQMEQMGCLVINSSISIQIAMDKILTMHRAALAGIPIPTTLVQNGKDPVDAWTKLSGGKWRNCVAKLPVGSHGAGVQVCFTQDVLRGSDPGSDRLEEVLIKIDGLLRLAHPQTSVDRVSMKYLRVLNLMSKGLHHGGNASWFGGLAASKQALGDAETECEAAMREADEALLTNLATEERNVIEQLRPFLLINWLQLIAEQAKLNFQRTPAEAEKLLRERNAIQSLRSFLERNPFLWHAAYNGLEIASTLKLDGDALYFYGKLTELDPGFRSFDYSPGEVLAISAEPGMTYFSQRHREKLHQPIIRKTAKRKAGG